MLIGIIGKFNKLHDEEYIARSFESLGHDVIRIEQSQHDMLIHKAILTRKPKILLFTKWEAGAMSREAVKKGKEWGMKTVCWLFDLYLGYEREHRIPKAYYFKADYVFTTDGGDDSRWEKYGIKHRCLRQGIYDKECYIKTKENPDGIIFVGSDNPFYPERTKIMDELKKDYPNFKWYGRHDTDHVRGEQLNELYSTVKIVVGDSVYSPGYWSNRIVETLGRGGFLIHRYVPGIVKEYPHLVTYDGTYVDLINTIDYYLKNDKARESLRQTNFKWVKEKYTMDKQCAKLLEMI